MSSNLMKFLKTKKYGILISTMFFVLSYSPESFSNDSNLKKNQFNTFKKNSSSNKEILLTDKNLLELIEKYNLKLINSKLNITQNKLLLKSELSAWYPKLNLSSNGLPKYIDGYTYNSPSSSLNTLSRQITTSLNAEVKWDIINPLRKPEIISAKKKLKKAKLNYLVNLKDIELDAIEKFYFLQQAQEELKVAKKSLQYSKVLLNEAKINFDSGIGTKLELLEAKTQFFRDKKLVSQAIGDKKIKRRNLLNIINHPKEDVILKLPQPQAYGIWDYSLKESIKESYNYSKKLEINKIDQSINNIDAKKALALKKPTISIFNTFSSNFNRGQSLVSSPNMDAKSSVISNTIGLSATWNIIDGGKAKSLYKYNKSKTNESQNKAQMVMNNLKKDVERFFFKLETEMSNIITTKKEVESSNESLRLARLRFQSGISTQREVVNNQRDLTDAQYNFLKSVTNYNIYISKLKRLTGITQIDSCDSIKKKLITSKINKEFLDVICKNN